jgi:hypothetical protein
VTTAAALTVRAGRGPAEPAGEEAAAVTGVGAQEVPPVLVRDPPVGVGVPAAVVP